MTNQRGDEMNKRKWKEQDKEWEEIERGDPTLTISSILGVVLFLIMLYGVWILTGKIV